MANEPFEIMLTGGHPNSLGRTIEVVNIILADQSKLEALYECYFSADEVVRLRTSNAFKRIWRENPSWIVPYIDCFIDTIANIEQASANWTTSDLFRELDKHLSEKQRQQAIIILKGYLENSDDWIVLNSVMQTLGKWATKNDDLKDCLLPHLEKLAKDKRNSVSKRANKLLILLTK